MLTSTKSHHILLNVVMYFLLYTILSVFPSLTLADSTSIIYNTVEADSLKINIEILEKENDYVKLIQPLIQLIEFYGNQNDPKKVHDYRFKLAICYLNLGFYNYAIPLLEYCQVYFRQSDYGLQYVRSLHLLTFANIENRHRDMAHYFLTQCEGQKPDKNDPYASLEHSLLDIILNSKMSPLAKRNRLSKIIQFSKGYQFDELTRIAYLEAGNLLYNQSEFDKAIAAFNQSLLLAEKLKLLDAKNKLFFKLYEVYNKKKNFEKSNEYLLNYSSLKDSIYSIHSNQQLNKTIFKHEQKSNREEGIELAKDKRLFELKTRRTNFTLYGLLFGIAAILIGGYFIIYFYQHKIEASDIIHEQNEQINTQKITELENNMKLQNLSSMLVGQEQERERIAKDLHDSLGGLLSTIKIRFDKIFSNQQNEENRQEYNKIQNLVDIACTEVRSIAHDLKPGTLKEAGLHEAIGDLLNRYNKGDGFEITYQHYGFDGEQTVNSTISLQVYRIIQELVHNSIKHSNPKDILVQLTLQEKQLEIIVEDNGNGFNPNKVTKGMGLENIHSRVSYLNGEIHIDSNEESGTSSMILIPIE